jgi:hypothetical protein
VASGQMGHAAITAMPQGGQKLLMKLALLPDSDSRAYFRRGGPTVESQALSQGAPHVDSSRQ